MRKCLFAVAVLLASIFYLISCTAPVTTTPPASTTATPTSTVSTTPTITVTPTPTQVTVITYDFDSGTPGIVPGVPTPFDYIQGGLTAHFSSSSDPAAFSVQNPDSTFVKLTRFSENYLNDNNAFLNTLEIKFSQSVRGIELTFATADYHGVGEVEIPTSLKLTAYLESTTKTVVGTATANGAFTSDTFPQGKLSFASGNDPFNLVVLELVPQPKGTTFFLVDTIIITM